MVRGLLGGLSRMGAFILELILISALRLKSVNSYVYS